MVSLAAICTGAYRGTYAYIMRYDLNAETIPFLMEAFWH
jgi:hypothetical protein